MLVKRGSVETAEAVRIVGKMSRPPIEDHAETGAVAGRDQLGKIRRRSETAGRSEQAGWVIGPGAVEGMLADRQAFHRGEPHVARVTGQLRRQPAVAEPTGALSRPSAPG